MIRQSTASHGANLVANASFGTVLMVSAALFITAAWNDAPFEVYVGLVLGVVGAGLGYWLWRRQAHVLATTIHTGGLIGSGALCLAATESLGGPTAILLLGSVITAGGLLGTRGALASICTLFVAIPAGFIWSEEIRVFLGFAPPPSLIPEYFITVFVVTSIPSWAAYVVAIDASNRTAWLNAQRAADGLADANRQLAIANQQLLLRQEQLEQAIEQQAAVARLGVYAAGTASTHKVAMRASRLLSRLCGLDEPLDLESETEPDLSRLTKGISPESRPFAHAVFQLVQAHTRRNAAESVEPPVSPIPSDPSEPESASLLD